jgi:hypothetical protein
MAKKEEIKQQARKKVQNAIELAEEQHKRELLRKRIELANEGVRAYQMRKPGEAVKKFLTYIKILEDWKGCGDGGLNPSHFDKKADMAEMLLISGIYWDLVKLYDRTKSPQKHKDFLRYVEKYVLFSRGMPYQALCAETLRRYISNDKPLHRDDFKSAYRIMTGGKSCFVATALADVCEPATLPRLRRFRDEQLEPSRAGRAFTAAYYACGPSLAGLTDHLPQAARRALGRVLDRVAFLVAR